MRIRLPFAGVFFILLLVAAYAGLTTLQAPAFLNDKVLHLVTFFLLTVVFYWIVDTSRRRSLNLTLVTCTGLLGVGSEFVQSFLPNDRQFDIYDILANVVGSLAALGVCSWYHKRMLERKRGRKHYTAVPGEDGEDLELGESRDLAESSADAGAGADSGAAAAARSRTLEEEVDNWDENAVDNWEHDDDDGRAGDLGVTSNGKGKEVDTGDIGDAKKRTD